MHWERLDHKGSVSCLTRGKACIVELKILDQSTAHEGLSDFMMQMVVYSLIKDNVLALLPV